MRRFPLPLLIILITLLTRAAHGQSPNGTISGLVLDPSERAIVGAEVLIVNDVTGVKYAGTTNEEGIYAVPNLSPGPYRIQVSKIGFKTLIKPDVLLNVQSAVAINFTLPVGAVSETLTVKGGAPLVNTESGSVSTVIDRNFVENLPLNGRSFNTLLQLTPGVVIAQSGPTSQGQFSVAGQRTSANNFLLDGVSANFGVAPTFGLGTSGTGAAQALSVLGGTSSLVSVEALQEFRVETSSFAPEFGRSPGGQVLMTTRSGTNELHGGIYEYFRNDVLDANNWFANRVGQPRAPERHNDFGGFLGGPIEADKTFFFLSYEGARLRQPSSNVVQVPSEYARTTAAAQLAPFLKAYPRPTDRTITAGMYTAEFTGSYSNPATLNAGGIRIDHNLSDRFSLFGRYNESPSEATKRNNSLSEQDATEVRTRTLTLSANMSLGATVSNTVRGNYSIQRSRFVSRLDTFGDAVPVDIHILAPQPIRAEEAIAAFFTFDTGFYSTGPSSRNESTQLTFADDLTLTRGTHQLKFGADYRAILLNVRPYESALQYLVSSVPNFLSTGEADFGVFGSTTRPSRFLVRASSAYAQDTWKVQSRVTVTFGARWEISPAPAPRGGTDIASWKNVDTPTAMVLAPAGTPPWSTVYTNFSPRLGIAIGLNPKGDFVLRAATGVFHDLGVDAAGSLASSFPNNATSCCAVASLPLTDASPYLPSITRQPPFPDGTVGFAPDLQTPSSLQWNVALEKSFGARDVISATYLGQSGNNLLRREAINQPNSDFPGSFLLIGNSAHSNYNALQLQYRRPLAGRLQVLLNYTWSHSLDNASNDSVAAIARTVISTANDYGASDFDVRHSVSGALSFAVPGVRAGPWSRMTRGWSLETLTTARSGFPFNATVLTATVGGVNPRPDIVAGQPYWISNPPAAAGKSLNPAAFSLPASGGQGTERRNDISGFGLAEVDLSLGRKFALTDRLNLQFRADAFNVFNHPNFTNPQAFVGVGNAFLQSSSMLNQGLGGLNPLFQQGGPRSLQLSLKLSF